MSEYFYKKHNREKTINLYNKKLIYNKDISTMSPDEMLAAPDGYEPTNLINFGFAEKRLYGRVTRFYHPMIPSSLGATFRSIKRSEESRNPQKALNFVVDAFEKLAMQFDKSTLVGKIDTTDKYLSSLVAYRAYEDPKALYRNHLNIYKNSISGIFAAPFNKGFTDFNQFINKLIPILQKSARKNPFTMPAFIKSSFCPITTSGLVIEIAAENIANDFKKIKLFKKSNNWGYYLNACKAYGFMVDRDIPWRLVADIGSAQMVGFAAQYELTTTDAILDTVYQKAFIDYYKRFKLILLEIYNSVKNTVYETHRCADGTLVTKMVEPTEYTEEVFNREFNDDYFLKLYFKIRFFEEESRFTENEQSILIDDALELAPYGINHAIEAFERILNKTFDYAGSLSYIKERQKILPTSQPPTGRPSAGGELQTNTAPVRAPQIWIPEPSGEETGEDEAP